MRRTATAVRVQRPLPIPRGWIIIGAAVASWALFLGLSATVGPLFLWLLASI